MAKIPLTIDKNYCASWNVFCGIRELLQNAKDADDDGHAMTVEHLPRTNQLVITNANISVDPARLLILGQSNKTPGQQRGQFGEGFVLGTLALLRHGHAVKFTNGALNWNVAFEKADANHPFAGTELLTFTSRKLAYPARDFRITVENITTEVWEALCPLFLFLVSPGEADTVQLHTGTLLLAPMYKGQIFARGIYVRAFPDLEYGYDMQHLALDRDRNALDEWKLHYELGRLWQEACRNNPERMSNLVYHLAKRDAPEVRSLQYHADAKLLQHLQTHFTTEHGTNAVPVNSMSDVRDVEQLGAQPVVASPALTDLLAKGGLSRTSALARQAGVIEVHFRYDELTPAEQAVVTRLTPFAPELAIVAYRGNATECRLIAGDSTVGLNRQLLGAPLRKILTAVLPVEAQRRQVAPVDAWLDGVCRLWACDAVEAAAPTVTANATLPGDDDLPF